jgi:fructose-1,6-bisphosphatase II
LPNAISVVSLAERDTMLKIPLELAYMDKIAVGPAGKGVIDINASMRRNLQALARSKQALVAELTVVILDRERNYKYVDEVRSAGARIKMISDGDVAGCVMAALPEHSGIDMLIGIGGSPEAIISASALKCLGGDMQCRPWPRDDREREACQAQGFDLNKVYNIDDLVNCEDVFFSATGITDGELLKGVRYGRDGASTHSLIMRSYSGTVRWVEARHDFMKLSRISGEMFIADA